MGLLVAADLRALIELAGFINAVDRAGVSCYGGCPVGLSPHLSLQTSANVLLRTLLNRAQRDRIVGNHTTGLDTDTALFAVVVAVVNA